MPATHLDPILVKTCMKKYPIKYQKYNEHKVTLISNIQLTHLFTEEDIIYFSRFRKCTKNEVSLRHIFFTSLIKMSLPLQCSSRTFYYELGTLSIYFLQWLVMFFFLSTEVIMHQFCFHLSLIPSVQKDNVNIWLACISIFSSFPKWRWGYSDFSVDK